MPTATYALPGGAALAWRFFSGRVPTPMGELGWKSLGVLELTALPSIDEALWGPLVQETDVLLVNGGDPLYLCSWMRQSGLADLVPSLHETVYVGLSAGSMVMAPTIGEDFVRCTPPTGGDATLGMVGFALFPHLDHEDLPDHSLADAERWAAGMPLPASAFDDQTAIQVVDGTVAVVSEGHWKLFSPEDRAAQRCARDLWRWRLKLGGLETLPKCSDAEIHQSSVVPVAGGDSVLVPMVVPMTGTSAFADTGYIPHYDASETHAIPREVIPGSY
jgi:dipeptidase E